MVPRPQVRMDHSIVGQPLGEDQRLANKNTSDILPGILKFSP